MGLVCLIFQDPAEREEEIKSQNTSGDLRAGRLILGPTHAHHQPRASPNSSDWMTERKASLLRPPHHGLLSRKVGETEKRHYLFPKIEPNRYWPISSLQSNATSSQLCDLTI